MLGGFGIRVMDCLCGGSFGMPRGSRPVPRAVRCPLHQVARTCCPGAWQGKGRLGADGSGCTSDTRGLGSPGAAPGTTAGLIAVTAGSWSSDSQCRFAVNSSLVRLSEESTLLNDESKGLTAWVARTLVAVLRGRLSFYACYSGISPWML
jgi:hypothetical protein